MTPPIIGVKIKTVTYKKRDDLKRGCIYLYITPFLTIVSGPTFYQKSATPSFPSFSPSLPSPFRHRDPTRAHYAWQSSFGTRGPHLWIDRFFLRRRRIHGAVKNTLEEGSNICNLHQFWLSSQLLFSGNVLMSVPLEVIIVQLGWFAPKQANKIYLAVGSPTHLKNINSSNWIHFPHGSRVKIPKKNPPKPSPGRKKRLPANFQPPRSAFFGDRFPSFQKFI